MTCLGALGATAWLLQGRSAASAFLWPDTVEGWWILAAILAVSQTTFHTFGLYRSRRWAGRETELRDLLRACLLVSVSISVMVAGFESVPSLLRAFPLSFAVVFFFGSAGLTALVRIGYQRWRENRRRKGYDQRRMVVIGTNARARSFADRVRARPELGYWVIGHVDEPWRGLDEFLESGGTLLAGLDDFPEWAAAHADELDEVVVALSVSKAYVHAPRLLDVCTELGATVRFFTQIFDLRLAEGKLEIYDNEPMISLPVTVHSGFPRLIKAIFDRVAAFVLLILVAPLLLTIAIAVKLGSEGPVFFVQERMGFNKRRFRLYKFRTMVENAEQLLPELEHLNEVSGPVFKLERDPRSTSIGELLRRTSLDELPQLWNVLIGDMSLVGPRPLPLRDYAGFDSDAHRRRLSVKPGITGLWQVSGRNAIGFDDWMAMDLHYIDHWSLWLDLKLLLLTVPEVLGPFWPRSSEGRRFGRRGGF